MFLKVSRWLLAVMVLVVVAALAACGPSATTGSKVEVTGAWVRSASMAAEVSSGMATQEATSDAMGDMATKDAGADSMGGMNMDIATSAAYMVIKNSGGQPDALVSAQSDVAKAVELHNVKMSNDVMTMFQVPKIDVPANGQVELKSGSYHVMLIDLTRDLKTGDKVTITLNFEKSGSMTIEAGVRDQ